MGQKLNMLGNICLGGGLGLASGYSYRKYSQITSMGFGLGFLATGFKKRALKYLDLNQDGRLDAKDLEVAEENLGLDLTWVGALSFAGGFSGGYLISTLW